MAQEIDARYARHQQRLARSSQAQVLRFWDQLDSAERTALLDDLDAVDLDLVDGLIDSHVRGEASQAVPDAIEPPEVFPVEPDINRVGRYADALKRGVSFIRTGKVAALTVAGGQGTRLGFDGPKGAYAISPVKGKSLFELFAEGIAGMQARTGGCIPWYIMTSPGNHDATCAFFDQHNYFGLDRDTVMLFRQGVMPALTRTGEMLLDQPHRLALSPDGHGGTLRALAATGALADMATRGVEFISYFQVDNPLVKPIDPLFIGLVQLEGAEMGAKVIPKNDDFEKVGIVAQVAGSTRVIEYTDLPDALATARDEQGRRRYDAGNIAVHVFRRGFVERLTGSTDGVALPWHRAVKKVPFVDDAGVRVEPDEPNAIKLETFVFDALPLAKKAVVLETRRAEEFSPVKNAAGTDSAETSRRDMIRRAADWLENSGGVVPRRPDGEPDAIIEVSPLLALDATHLRERLGERPTVERGASLYLEP